ncbi:NADH-quinone oxidoreductase subunit N [Bdellovibrionota bacterium]
MNFLPTNFSAVVPELILVFALVAVLLVGLWQEEMKRFLGLGIALLGLAIAFIVVWFQPTAGEEFFSMITLDRFGRFFKIMVLIISASTAIFGFKSQEIPDNRSSEFFAILLALTLGLLLLSVSTNLTLIFLSIEMVTISSVILVGINREKREANEAALKFIAYSVVVSGILIFGFSLLYGMTHSLNIWKIHTALMSGASNQLGISAILLLLLVGFGFKIAMVPLHMWAPDVFQAAPTPVSAFLSTATLAAGFAILIRILFGVFAINQPDGTFVPLGSFDWSILLAGIAALTMTLGNLAAMRQEDAKRLLGYSTVAHVGFLLMGLVVMNKAGLAALLMYLVAFYFMNYGAFLIIGALADKTKSTQISSFRGLGLKSPFICCILVTFLFSLSGIPPFGGFLGKFELFRVMLHKGAHWLLVLAVVNCVISFFTTRGFCRRCF